jgi:hypothetical protein
MEEKKKKKEMYFHNKDGQKLKVNWDEESEKEIWERFGIDVKDEIAKVARSEMKRWKEEKKG